MKQKYVVLGNEYQKCKNTEMLLYTTCLRRRDLIQEGFLLYLLNNEIGYKYLLDCIVNNESELIFKYDENDNEEYVRIYLSDAINLLSSFKLNSDQEEKITKVIPSVNKFRLIEYYDNKIYTKKINGKEYNIACKDLLDIFFSKDIYKEDLYQKYDQGIIWYLISEFIKDNNILERYRLAPSYINRLIKIRNNQDDKIDIQSVNGFENKSSFDDVIVSDELKNILYMGMNSDYNNLEKAIYIYIKMCRYLSYDPYFYANNQSGDIAEFHKNINRLGQIKNNDNYVVCYEFNAIYGKLLEELNIRCETSISEYGKGHASLNFVVDKYIVHADAVTSILGGDMINAKLNFALEGLVCLNDNEKTKEDFNMILDDIYGDVVDYEIDKGIDDHELFNLLLIYRGINEIEQKKDENMIHHKMNIVFEELNATNLKTVDMMGYLIRLKNVIFTDYERKHNFSLVIMKSTLDEKEPLAAIITINEEGNIKEGINNRYFYYTCNHPLVEISKNKLENLLYNNKLEYIRYVDLEIPGINKKRGNR